MVNLPKPEVIVTHESDLDGFVAGHLLQMLAGKLFAETPRLEAWHYDGWRQRPLKENNAWVTDIALDSRMDKLGWLVVDHHPTEVTPKLAKLIHDPAKSASLLAYELCQQHDLGSPELSRLAALSNVADLFLAEDPEFILATDYANLLKSYQFWSIHALIQGDLSKLLNHPLLEVMAVKRRVEDPIGLAWSRANIAPITPTVGYVDTVVGNTNLILHQILVECATPYEALITMFRKGNGTVVASIRSRNGTALKVAEKLQGGGHANAAGATLPRSVQRIPDAIDYLKKVLNPAPPKKIEQSGLESLFADQ